MITSTNMALLFAFFVGFERYIKKNHHKHSPRFIFILVSIIMISFGAYLLWGATYPGTFRVALIIFGSMFSAVGLFYFFEGVFSKQETLKIKIESMFKPNENNESQNT